MDGPQLSDEEIKTVHWKLIKRMEKEFSQFLKKTGITLTHISFNSDILYSITHQKALVRRGPLLVRSQWDGYKLRVVFENGIRVGEKATNQP